ncbi:hypothetical protein BAY61_02220 [Prauserella marina]|nr:DUF3558 domain-containing protein [Prauserella marina]ASR34002.1 hypothetical protein BAY61_02220 [Prauserella marina]
MRHTGALVITLLTSILLASCSATSKEHASSNGISDTTGSTPGPGVPRVDIPLQVDHFLETPCDAITKHESRDFVGINVTAEPDPSGATGPSCRWGRSLGEARIYVGFPQVSDSGLTALYDENGRKFAFFEEMPPADDYPAVAYGVSDNRDKGECSIRVGMSNESTVDITLILSDDRVGELDPCEAAHEVATAVIGNIKARN